MYHAGNWGPCEVGVQLPPPFLPGPSSSGALSLRSRTVQAEDHLFRVWNDNLFHFIEFCYPGGPSFEEDYLAYTSPSFPSPLLVFMIWKPGGSLGFSLRDCLQVKSLSKARKQSVP